MENKKMSGQQQHLSDYSKIITCVVLWNKKSSLADAMQTDRQTVDVHVCRSCCESWVHFAGI